MTRPPPTSTLFPYTTLFRSDGGRSVLLTVEKSGATSTLAIIQGIKAKMAQLKAILPAALDVAPIGDQSVFVTAAIKIGEHTSELQSPVHLVCRLLLEKKK